MRATDHIWSERARVAEGASIRKIRRDRGIALILTIFGLLLLTGIAAAMMFSSDSETTISINYRDKQAATYAAFSGLQEARDRIHPVSGDLAASGFVPTQTPDAGGLAGGQVLYLINPAPGETVASIAPWAAVVNGQPNPYFDQEFCQEKMLGMAGTPGVACGAAQIPAGACTQVGGGGGSWCQYYDESANNGPCPGSGCWKLTSAGGQLIPLNYKWVRITLKEDWNTPAYVPSPTAAVGNQVCWDGNYQAAIPAGYNSACAATPGNVVIGLNVVSGGTGYNSAPTVAISGGGGSGATATAQIGPTSAGSISGVTLSSGGSGYTSPPTVTVASPDGTGATFQAITSGAPITGVTVNNSNTNYCYSPSSLPSIGFSTNPPSSTVTAAQATVNVANNGCIYYVSTSGSCTNEKNKSVAIGASTPPGGGSGFAGTVNFSSSGQVSSITVSSVGSGYSSGTTTININGNCSITPSFSTGVQISGVTVASGGDYMSAPTASLGGNPPAQPSAPTLPAVAAQWSAAGSTITGVQVLTGGSGYLQSNYTLIFTGGGGTGAAATASTATVNSVTGFTVTNAGSGYTSTPTVTLNNAGTGGSGASATATIAAGGINQSMGQVYLLTSLGVTSTGAKSMAQMEVGIRPPFTFNLGGAVTLAGPFVLGGPQPIFPNSANFTVNGNDADTCGGTASSSKPAIGVYDSYSQQTVINDLGKPQNYTGAGGTPSVENIYSAIGGASATPAALNAFVQSLQPYATNYYTGTVGALPATTTSSITYVNGNLTASGNVSGSGILVVTGTLTFGGNFTWNGLVLVIGQGVVVHQGGGNGTFNGAIYVANTLDASNNTLSTLGTPQYIWNGGGTNQIQYDHCLSDALLQKYNGQPNPWPLQILSSRMLQF